MSISVIIICRNNDIRQMPAKGTERTGTNNRVSSFDYYFCTLYKIFQKFSVLNKNMFVCFFSSVNSAFSTLRNLIPTEPKNRKLSKIETLRLATSYIEHLGAILLTG